MRIPAGFVLAALLSVVGPMLQAQPDAAQVQKRVDELKAGLRANRKQLAKYQWLQTVEIAVKDNKPQKEQFMCQYNPDGTVRRTPTGPPPAAPDVPKHGFRGHKAKKNAAEMEDYTERLKTLVGHYAPPQPEMLKSVAKAGNASLTTGGDVYTLVFSDYYKPGDEVTIGYDPVTRRVVRYAVNTFLDDPKNDNVTLTNQFAQLPDGTNYLQQTVLNSQSKQITVTTTNSGYSLPTK